ncbi:hypothetical protein [Candidatus Manganitrophus noduliformans]|uniref:Uncharacterized protein n=1 Tax=Candidatus Manganitrophus noduliformans TaxID=2606439 RepID=A0A7X6DQB6_9BACT|nr:hypothetical protein [Candidatus Manganitrophus noduliformans]NKE71317.1 hypothetical protein [Candidatus Manganitrophus noduliformans]
MSVAARILAALTCVLSFAVAHAADIASSTATRSALLGGGYQSEKEDLLAQQCVQGTEVFSGSSQATFSFDQALTEQQASEQLGLSAGGRARFGAVETSGSAKFMRSVVSNEYSISAVWLSEYKLPSRKLSAVTRSPIGNSVAGDIERWAETCGDEYVDEIKVGSRLFFSIRIDFTSKERKQSFQSQFSVSGPLYSADASLQQASREYGRDAKITVTALQMGGDVSKLTGIFPNTPEGSTNFVQCGLGDLTQCTKVTQAALTYATDVQRGFPAQLAPGATPGGSPLEYKTARYSQAGIHLQDGYPFLTEIAREARKTLHGDFEREFRRQVLANRLIELGMGKEQLEKVLAQKEIIDSNLAKIADASKICYESVPNCAPTVKALNLSPVDDGAFQLPALPRASFRVLTTSRGVWGREESVAAMTEMLPAPHGAGRRELSAVAPNESASVILLIEGAALRTAQLFFENRGLKTIPLTQEAGSYAEKYGPGRAAVVVETTRNNPGWRDVDLWDERKKLWRGDIPSGDGVFFLVVRDGFGRDTRFDIEYQKWSRIVTSTPNANNGRTATETFEFRNRWWTKNDGGTSVSGEGDWSNSGSATLSGPD